MQFKSKENVHFITSLTVEEEIKLLNMSDEQEVNIPKTFGKSLILPNEEASKNPNLEFIDLRYDQTNERAFHLLMMLISSPPFYNFVENVQKSCKKMPPLISDFVSIIEAIKNKENVSIENFIRFENCKDVIEGYRFILASVHDQLLSYFYFSEDSWIVPNKEKVLKPIFQSFSPISNMFHGKLLKEIKGIPSGYFDVVRNGTSESLVELFKSKDLIQVPNILLIETNELLESIPEGYTISSIIAEEDYTVLYIHSGDKWFKYKRDGMSIIDSLEGGLNIQYVLISRSS